MITKEDLYRLYWEEQKSLEQVGKELGTSKFTITLKMKEFDIPRRTLSESAKIRAVRDNTCKTLIKWQNSLSEEEKETIRNNRKEMYEKRKILIPEDELQELYIDKKMSVPQIAKIYNVDGMTIYSRLKEYNIPIRTISEAFKVMHKQKPNFNNPQKHSKTMKRRFASGEIEPWNKGLKGYREGCELSEETKEKIGKANSPKMKLLWQNPEYREHMVKVHKEAYKKDPDLLRRVLTCQKPNKIEQELIDIFTDYDLPYKYVGNGDFILGGKCPDFLNVNGEKKLIEFYGDYWHQDDDPQERIDFFKEYGFNTLVIWGSEFDKLTEEELVSKILEFTNEKEVKT